MKKMGIICMILLFSMGTVDMGYAGWCNVISTQYDVATGIVSAGIRNHGTNDNGPDPCSHGGRNAIGADIGYARCEDGPSEYELNGRSYSEEVKVDIYGYQSYAPVCTLEMANCGSIPVKVDQILIDWDGDLAGNIQVGNWSIDCPDGYRKKGQGLTSLGDTIKYLCLDPKQKMWLDLEFRVGQKNDLKDTLAAANEALSVIFKTKTAEAAKNEEISPNAAETNTTESAPAPESEKSSIPVQDSPSSPAEAPGIPSTGIPGDQSGDKPAAGEASSDVPVYILPEEPVSKTAGDSSETSIDAAPKTKCGSATGTITITYRRWNEQW